MKTILKITLCFFFLGALTNGYAAILTVDNNPSNDAMYSSFTAARNAANVGDTILLHSSGVNYGNLDVNKSLTVIGTGHSGPQRVLADYLRITANNVTVEGIYFAKLYYTGLYVHTTYNNIAGDNILIKNCIIRNSFSIADGRENIMFLGCVIGFATPEGSYIGYVNTSSFSSAQNVTFLNNIIKVFKLGSPNSTWLYQNNIIVKPSSDTDLFDCDNQNFTNNIFYVLGSANWDPENCSNCVFQNNLTYSPEGVLSDLPISNLNNTVPTWDLNEDATWFFNLESNYHMLSGTPSTGAADGGEVGIYGNGYNFRMLGMPVGFPRVTSTAILNPVLSSGGELQIEFEAEGDTN